MKTKTMHVFTIFTSAYMQCTDCNLMSRFDAERVREKERSKNITFSTLCIEYILCEYVSIKAIRLKCFIKFNAKDLIDISIPFVY